MSPESPSIDAEWISKLLHPVRYDGFDLVTPTYRRHKFEGLLITNLLYPMTRALYGLRIREPYMQDFGFSGRLGSEFLAQNAWADGSGDDGVELRLTLAAITGQQRICQSFLGQKGACRTSFGRSGSGVEANGGADVLHTGVNFPDMEFRYRLAAGSYFRA